MSLSFNDTAPSASVRTAVVDGATYLSVWDILTVVFYRGLRDVR